MFNKRIRPYFQFTRQERWGAVLLIGMLLGLYGLASLFPTRKIQADPPEVHHTAHPVPASTEGATEAVRPFSKIALSEFDPNQLSESGWIELGIAPRTARTIRNYLSKGGRFRTPSDLGKIWGLKPADRDRLLPYVRISTGKLEPDMSQYSNRPAYSKGGSKPTAPITIDINRSDSVDWEALPGIGPVFARRIVRYRDRLGGFASVDQIKETYQLPDSVFQRIRPYLRSGEWGPIRKISLNTVTVDSLGRHPYCNFSMARSIVRYREQHGPFRNLEDLLNLQRVDSAWWLRMRPYLSIE